MDHLNSNRQPHPIIFLLSIALLSGGCVERTLLIESQPPGGLVFLDDELLRDDEGAPRLTPTEISFQHYGTRGIVVRREGHLSAKRLVDLDPPIYQIFPLDLFTELLIPYTFHDQHRIEIVLEPSPTPTETSRGALLERARAYRQERQEPAEVD